MNDACCLDFVVGNTTSSHPTVGNHTNESLRRRIKLAQQLTLKRVVEKNSFIKKSNNATTDTFNAIYRNQFGNPYKLCTFVGDNDIVVAIDNNNCMDIISFGSQEPNRLYSNNTYSERTNRCSSPNSVVIQNNHQPFGSSIASGLKVSSNYYDDSCAKVQCTQDGENIIVGMTSGVLNVYGTESQSVLSSYRNSKLVSDILSGTASCLQRLTNASCPYRRFQRDNKYSLANQLRNTYSSHHLTIELSEIYDDATIMQPFATTMGLARCSDSCWDFRQYETGSHIHSIFVSRHADAFYVYTTDSRQPNTDSHQKKGVCVDTDLTGDSVISSASFVSDYVVATSTIIGYKDPFSSSSLKIWDLRYMGHSESNFVTELTLPSYPNDPVFSMRGEPIWSTQKGTLKSAAIDSLIYEKKIIKSVTPIDDSGNLVLHVINSSSEEFIMVDPVRRTTIGKAIAVDFLEDCNQRIRNPSLTAFNKTISMVGLHQPQSSLLNLITIKDFLRKRRKNSKRKSLHDSKDITSNPFNFINTETKDRYGLQTQLSYISFNHSGSKIAGVTVDGDIFVW